MKLTKETLTELFGEHYGYSFYLLQTNILDFNKTLELVEEGALSPQEIHNIVSVK